MLYKVFLSVFFFLSKMQKVSNYNSGQPLHTIQSGYSFLSSPLSDKVDTQEVKKMHWLTGVKWHWKRLCRGKCEERRTRFPACSGYHWEESGGGSVGIVKKMTLEATDRLVSVSRAITCWGWGGGGRGGELDTPNHFHLKLSSLPSAYTYHLKWWQLIAFHFTFWLGVLCFLPHLGLGMCISFLGLP